METLAGLSLITGLDLITVATGALAALALAVASNEVAANGPDMDEKLSRLNARARFSLLPRILRFHWERRSVQRQPSRYLPLPFSTPLCAKVRRGRGEGERKIGARYVHPLCPRRT